MKNGPTEYLALGVGGDWLYLYHQEEDPGNRTVDVLTVLKLSGCHQRGVPRRLLKKITRLNRKRGSFASVAQDVMWERLCRQDFAQGEFKLHPDKSSSATEPAFIILKGPLTNLVVDPDMCRSLEDRLRWHARTQHDGYKYKWKTQPLWFDSAMTTLPQNCRVLELKPGLARGEPMDGPAALTALIRLFAETPDQTLQRVCGDGVQVFRGANALYSTLATELKNERMTSDLALDALRRLSGATLPKSIGRVMFCNLQNINKPSTRQDCKLYRCAYGGFTNTMEISLPSRT